MPTAPTYGLSKVALAPLPGARLSVQASPEAFGSEIGSTVASAGAKIYQEERDKADEQAVFEARRKMNDWELANIYDPKTGAITKRGKDSFGLPEQLDESFDKNVGDVMAGLSTDKQRFAVQKMAEARRMSTNEWAQKHVAVEREKFYVNEYSADVESSAERAANDPSKAAGELGIIRQRTLTFAQDRGMGPQETQQLLQKVTTNTHAKVVKGFIAAGAVNDATNWLNANKAGIDPDTFTALQTTLKPAADQAKGMIIADEIDKTATTYDEAQQAARKAAGDNATAYKVAMAEFEHRRNTRERDALLLNKHNDQAVDGFMAKVYAGGRAPNIAQLKMLPEFQAMDGTQQLQAIDKARTIARSLKAEANAGGEGKTDPLAYGQALEKITAGGMSVSDVAAMPGLNRSTKMALMGEVVKMNNGQDNDIPNLKQAQSIFTSTFLGMNNNKKLADMNEGDRQRLGEMQRTYEERLRDLKATMPKGAKINTGQMQQVADDMFLRGRVEGSGFHIPLFGTFGQKEAFKGDLPRGAQFVPKEVNKYEDIPLTYRNLAADALLKAGLPVTPNAVRDKFNADVRAKFGAAR